MSVKDREFYRIDIMKDVFFDPFPRHSEQRCPECNYADG